MSTVDKYVPNRRGWKNSPLDNASLLMSMKVIPASTSEVTCRIDELFTYLPTSLCSEVLMLFLTNYVREILLAIVESLSFAGV
jgi:hypothetical protein